jgi:hypothetical protein
MIQTGNAFTIPDDTPLTPPITIVANPVDPLGKPAPVTGAKYDTSQSDPTILGTLTSTDGINASVQLPSPLNIGSTSVAWSALNASGAQVNGMFTFTISSEGAVSVTFTMTAPDPATAAPAPAAAAPAAS